MYMIGAKNIGYVFERCRNLEIFCQKSKKPYVYIYIYIYIYIHIYIYNIRAYWYSHDYWPRSAGILFFRARVNNCENLSNMYLCVEVCMHVFCPPFLQWSKCITYSNHSTLTIYIYIYITALCRNYAPFELVKMYYIWMYLCIDYYHIVQKLPFFLNWPKCIISEYISTWTITTLCRNYPSFWTGQNVLYLNISLHWLLLCVADIDRPRATSVFFFHNVVIFIFFLHFIIDTF
jgi:hypothetical protein